MDKPRVGVGVIVARDGKVLMGKRLKVQLGYDMWAFPGGAVDAGETILDCALRELEEETGLAPKEFTYNDHYAITEDIAEGQHWLTVYVLIIIPSTYQQEPVTREPSKCAEWRWFNLRREPLPDDTWAPVIKLFTYGKPEVAKDIKRTRERTKPRGSVKRDGRSARQTAGWIRVIKNSR